MNRQATILFYRRQQQGFTLIELMIVIVIVAILALIAFPSYNNYIVKTKRTAAEGCLMQYANYMERLYATDLRYDKAKDLPTLACANDQDTGGSYTYGFASSTLTSSTYTIQAAPKGTDAQCGTLSLDQSGTRGVSSGTVSACWQ